MSKNVAQQLVDMLSQAGVKHLYAVTGDSLNFVNQAITNSDTIRWIHVRHEECGAFAAEAEAYFSGIGCCAGSSGPGHVHLINGLYDANRNHLPVVAIASTCASSEMGTGFFQETNTIRLFDDCTVYNQLAINAQQFARMMPAAIRTALSQHGVSVIGLPGDLASQPSQESTLPLPEFENKACLPSQKSLQELANLMSEHTKITLYCGHGCAKAHDEVVALANLLKAPMAYTYRGKMDLEYDNPNGVGMTGLLGIPSAYMSMFDCELLIMLGTDFPFEHFLPNKCTIVQIDTCAERIGRRANVSLGLVGDVKATLEQLMPLLTEKTDTSFLEEHLTLHEKVKKDMTLLAQDKGSNDLIAPEYLTTLIDQLASDNCIFTADTGMCCTWSARFLNATQGRDLLASFNHGTMCNSLPMAIGAALSQPNREVVALCGDGGLSMLLGELATVAQYKLPIKIVVYNNRSLGMVKLEMEADGLPDTQTDMLNPEFSQLAESLGILSYKVVDPELLESVLKEAFAQPGAVLVDVHTNPNALAMPPKVSLSQMKGISMAMARMLIAGDREETVNLLKATMKLL